MTTCKAGDSVCLDALAQADSSRRSSLSRACDPCQKHQRLCSFNQPCQSCLATKEACIYSWQSITSQDVLGLSSEVSSSNRMDMSVSSDACEQVCTTTLPHRPDMKPNTAAFEFLINFTTASGFANTFDNDLSFHKRQGRHGFLYSEAERSTLEKFEEFCTSQVTIDHSQLLIHGSESSQWYSTNVFGYPVLTDGLQFLDRPLSCHTQPIKPIFTERWLSGQQYHRPTPFSLDETKSTAHALQWNSDPLTLKAVEMVSRIKEATMLKPRNSNISFMWSAVVEEACLRFFCPLNLRKFIDLYWISWYPHWPVIHKPTFIASEAPCTLVAAMILIGASYSPNIADRDNSRVWLNAVEEIVFSDEYFCDDPDMITTAYDRCAIISRRRLQALQAAHAICLCQTFEGDEASKRRARHHRFNAVVTVSPERITVALTNR